MNKAVQDETSTSLFVKEAIVNLSPVSYQAENNLKSVRYGVGGRSIIQLLNRCTRVAELLMLTSQAVVF